MTRLPREALSDEERALAAQLPRPHHGEEPGALLDARILAHARAAVAATPARRPRPRVRWIAPMAVAASLSLAVGLAWRLQPPSAPMATAPSADGATAGLPAARMAMPPTEPPSAMQAVPLPRRLASPSPRDASADAGSAAAVAVAPPAADAASPAPPPPPPAAPQVAAAESAPVADGVAAAATPIASPPMAKAARATDAARERTPAPAAAAPRAQAQANESAVAADAAAGAPQPFIGDEPGDEVPPATVDSPEVRDAWLRRIVELLQQGRREEAGASLAEFRRRYPDAPLPAELRKLEP